MNRHKQDQYRMIPLIILFLTSTDTLIFGTNANRAFIYIPRISALVMSFYLPISKKDYKLRNIRSLKLMLLMILITFFSSIINGTETVTIISRILPILIAYVITEHYSLSDFFRAYDDFLYIVSISTVILYAVCILAPGLVRLLPSIVNENGLTYKTILLSNIGVTNLGNGLFTRMGGIFWEPGAFAIYLCIGLMIQLYYVEVSSVKRLILYLFAIGITFSTTGYICAFILFAGYIVQKREFKHKNLKYFIMAILIPIVFLSLFSEESALSTMVFSKIINRDPTTNVRLSSIINGMQIAFDHPWLGVGGQAGRYMPLYAYAYGLGKNKMLSNTVVHQFANYGFIFGTLFVVYTYKFFVRYFKHGLMISILLFITLLLLYVGEAFFSFLPFIFVMYGSSSLSTVDNKNNF